MKIYIPKGMKISDLRQLNQKEQHERRIKLFKLNQELYELEKVHYFESQAQYRGE